MRFLYMTALISVAFHRINHCEAMNNRPLIGILTQEYWKEPTLTHSYIAASYVKYIESAGARVVPILINQTETYYRKVYKITNGLLLPGGGQDLHTSGYAKAGRLLWQLSQKDSTRRYPIWATCLGFEFIGILYGAELSTCSAKDVNFGLDLRPDYKTSRLFSRAEPSIIKIVESGEAVTYNEHQKCIDETTFESSKLRDHFRIISTNKDVKDKPFISTMESTNTDFPIYGVQWHPEKNQFEFVHNNKWKGGPHQFNAIQLSQYMANFFVNESRYTTSQAIEEKSLKDLLIYNYQPLYTGAQDDYYYEQIYLFNMTQIH